MVARMRRRCCTFIGKALVFIEPISGAAMDSCTPNLGSCSTAADLLVLAASQSQPRGLQVSFKAAAGLLQHRTTGTYATEASDSLQGF
jgi:hypothetical protein